MRLLSSLWVRVAAGFLLVALAAVGLVALLANRATTHQFEVYVSQGRTARAERLAPLLADYYTTAGSWDGVAAYLDTLSTTPTGRGQGRGQRAGETPGGTADRLLLTSPTGQVIADSAGELQGETLPPAELAPGFPVEVDGSQVATLLISAPQDVHLSLESEFLTEVNRRLLWAGLAAAGLALLLGLLLARQITAPLRALTDAVQQVDRAGIESHPERSVPQVAAGDAGEIGDLGRAFNQMARSLAHQQTLRRHLMADIAHELRTPLSVIRSDLEALLDGLYQPTAENLASLQEETLLLARLVDDLQALAEAEAGHLRLAREPVDLGASARDVVSGLYGVAEAQGRPITLDLPPDLPPVDADRQRVRQVIANLLTNALRHTPDSSPIVISAVSTPGAVRLSVADRGPGIPAGDLPHVFDRFWRGGSRARGSGLGLAIAHELIRAHGGRIWVESQQGAGTTFSFTLPTVPAPAEAGPAPARHEQSSP
ncbi:MAG TPA: HAMP domain-containing sensor histidine kinase [Anaerolineae bacterium]|nr:HAMP domain-containing sensor histidine kinase [Anaerolineae bacterium]